MKFIQLLFLSLVAAAAFAEDRVRGLIPLIVVEGDSNSESSRIKGGAGQNGKRRVLKGGKGKGGKGTSSKAGPPEPEPECVTLQVWIRTGDILDNAIDSENGYATRVDLFQAETRTVIGSWYEQVQYINTAFTDGVGTGILVLSGGGSSISFSGVIRQRVLPISGGTGTFTCATGNIAAVRQAGSQTFLDVNYCLAC